MHKGKWQIGSPKKKKELERRRNYKRKGPQTKCHAEHTMQHRNEFTPKKKQNIKSS